MSKSVPEVEGESPRAIVERYFERMQSGDPEIGSMFAEARDDQASSEQTLDDLLSDAKDAVQKDKTKPRHPFRED